MGGEDSIYDYPLYYDILFGWDRDAEAGFYDAAFRRHGVRPGGRLLEVGVGTGQVALRLARRGWRVTGLDIRPEMLSFLEAAAAKAALRVGTVCCDMRRFTLEERQDGAYCPLSTFRVLDSDEAAMSHLRAVAGVLRDGGVYILDMFFQERAGNAGQPAGENWFMRRDGVEVRLDGQKVHVEDARAGRRLTLKADWPAASALRPYSGEAFANLLGQSGSFVLEAWYPEAGRSAEGISIFEVARPAAPPMVGRAMVVLKRTTAACR